MLGGKSSGRGASESGWAVWTISRLGGFEKRHEGPAMQLKHTLGRIGLHLPRHSAKGVLIMEAPRTGSGESWKNSQARWSNSGYDDPWPRA
jgi:hypothetical protein